MQPNEIHKPGTFLMNQEVLQLIRAIDDLVVQTIVLTMFSTGLRLGECTSLRNKDIDWERKIIDVQTAGRYGQRIVPINNLLYCRLLGYKATFRENATDDDLFFVTNNGGQVSSHRLCRVLHQATRSLGWKKQVTSYDLRRSFSEALLQHGVPLHVVNRLLGREDFRSPRFHAPRVTENGLRAAVETLWEIPTAKSK